MEIRPTSTDTLSTAQAITVAPGAPEGVPTRIKKLQTAIFAAQRALLSSSEDQRTQIRKISEELHLPPGRSFSTPKEHLRSILSTLKERVGEMKRKFNHRAAHPLAPQVEEPNGLSNLDCGLLQNIVQFCDTDTIRNLALTSRSLCLKIQQLHGQTVEQNGKDETKFFLQRIYNKEEALAKLRSSISSRNTEYVYAHCIKELQRDKDIQRIYLRNNYDGFSKIPRPDETSEDINYLTQCNKLKIIEFMNSRAAVRKKMILNENGINTPLKDLIRKISAPDMTLDKAIASIPSPLFETNYKRKYLSSKTIASKFPNDPEIVTLCESIFRHAPLTMRNNEEIVLQAVNMDGLSLAHASATLQNNPKVVLAAVRDVPEAFDFASNAMKRDPKVVLAVVQINGSALAFASDELKKDPKIVLAAVQNDPLALRFADLELQNNRDMVLAALHNTSAKKLTINEELLRDPEIRAAIKAQSDDSSSISSEYSSESSDDSSSISSEYSSESSDDSSSLSSESSDDSSSISSEYSSESSDDSSSCSSESSTDFSSYSSETSVNSAHASKKKETQLERITRLVTKETQARQHLLKKARVERPTYVQPHQTEHKRKHDHSHNHR